MASCPASSPTSASTLNGAVWSGSLEAVKVLVEAGAALDARDTLWDGTSLGWAEHAQGEHVNDERGPSSPRLPRTFSTGRAAAPRRIDVGISGRDSRGRKRDSECQEYV